MTVDPEGEGRAPSMRVDVNFEVLVRCGTGDFVARIVNLSAEGIRLKSEQRLEPGCVVDIELGTLPPVRAIVRWVDGSEAGAMFIDQAAV